MVFTGYCSNAEMCKFLDFGYYNEKDYIYNSSDTESVEVKSENGTELSLITGMHSMFVDGVSFADYAIDNTTGAISFTVVETTPSDDANIKIVYWLNVGLDDSDITDLVLDGSSEVEQDTSRIYRTVAVVDYAVDVNPDYDYVNPYTTTMYGGNIAKIKDYKNKDNVLELSYGPIQSVSALTVDGTSVTVSTLKLIGNKIMLTDDSEVGYFSRSANSIVLSFSYGITETALSQTEFEKSTLRTVKKANLLKSGMLLFDSPQGENLLYENSYLVSASNGSVRNDTRIEDMKRNYEKRYDKLVAKLKMQVASTI